jgi:hypothetical protein
LDTRSAILLYLVYILDARDGLMLCRVGRDGRHGRVCRVGRDGRDGRACRVGRNGRDLSLVSSVPQPAYAFLSPLLSFSSVKLSSFAQQDFLDYHLSSPPLALCSPCLLGVKRGKRDQRGTGDKRDTIHKRDARDKRNPREVVSQEGNISRPGNTTVITATCLSANFL